MNLEAVLNEIAGLLVSTGLTVYATIPDAGDFPALVLNAPSEIQYTKTHAGSCTIKVAVTLYVQTSDLGTAWSLAYGLLSYNSAGTPIPDALINHTPINYKNLTVDTANNFRPVGELGIAVDVNLTIFS